MGRNYYGSLTSESSIERSDNDDNDSYELFSVNESTLMHTSENVTSSDLNDSTIGNISSHFDNKDTECQFLKNEDRVSKDIRRLRLHVEKVILSMEIWMI